MRRRFLRFMNCAPARAGRGQGYICCSTTAAPGACAPRTGPGACKGRDPKAGRKTKTPCRVLSPHSVKEQCPKMHTKSGIYNTMKDVLEKKGRMLYNIGCGAANAVV